MMADAKLPPNGQGISADDQSAVIAFLSDPSHHGETVEHVERIDTHGAIIFLAGKRAFKLKRAVKLPYMDFSTLEKRAAACRHEVRRNAAAAPGIYVGALPIVVDPSGALTFGGRGKTIDWIVIMNRFAEADVFDNLASEGRLSLELMVPLANSIAEYHSAAQPRLEVDGDEIMARVITQTIRAFYEAADVFGDNNVRAYSRAIVNSLNALSGLLRSRARNGQVRLCHGDLHLRNIVLRDSRPTLFDAIEFDDSLATIDVLYDIAFLLMDLWHKGLQRHANAVLNAYASAALKSDHLSGLAALPVFLATRAGIRAMVAVDRAHVAGQTSALAHAKKYFELATDFLAPSSPRLIAVGGYSGTGKSTLAAALAPHFGRCPGALHLRSDVERKRMFGIDPLERLPQQAYSEFATERTYQRLCTRALAALKAGHSVVVDAVFISPHQRRRIEQAAAMAGTPFTGLWLTASEDRLAARVRDRRGDASDADVTVVKRQVETRSTGVCWEQIDANAPHASVAANAQSLLDDR
ncbi:MAG: AAA family ATPase [Hyphomicrobiaceae bacterium]